MDHRTHAKRVCESLLTDPCLSTSVSESDRRAGSFHPMRCEPCAVLVAATHLPRATSCTGACRAADDAALTARRHDLYCAVLREAWRCFLRVVVPAWRRLAAQCRHTSDRCASLPAAVGHAARFVRTVALGEERRCDGHDTSSRRVARQQLHRLDTPSRVSPHTVAHAVRQLVCWVNVTDATTMCPRLSISFIWEHNGDAVSHACQHTASQLHAAYERLVASEIPLFVFSRTPFQDGMVGGGGSEDHRLRCDIPTSRAPCTIVEGVAALPTLYHGRACRLTEFCGASHSRRDVSHTRDVPQPAILGPLRASFEPCAPREDDIDDCLLHGHEPVHGVYRDPVTSTVLPCDASALRDNHGHERCPMRLRIVPSRTHAMHAQRLLRESVARRDFVMQPHRAETNLLELEVQTPLAANGPLTLPDIVVEDAMPTHLRQGHAEGTLTCAFCPLMGARRDPHVPRRWLPLEVEWNGVCYHPYARREAGGGDDSRATTWDCVLQVHAMPRRHASSSSSSPTTTTTVYQYHHVRGVLPRGAILRFFSVRGGTGGPSSSSLPSASFYVGHSASAMAQLATCLCRAADSTILCEKVPPDTRAYVLEAYVPNAQDAEDVPPQRGVATMVRRLVRAPPHLLTLYSHGVAGGGKTSMLFGPPPSHGEVGLVHRALRDLVAQRATVRLVTAALVVCCGGSGGGGRFIPIFPTTSRTTPNAVLQPLVLSSHTYALDVDRCLTVFRRELADVRHRASIASFTARDSSTTSQSQTHAVLLFAVERDATSEPSYLAVIDLAGHDHHTDRDCVARCAQQSLEMWLREPAHRLCTAAAELTADVAAYVDRTYPQWADDERRRRAHFLQRVRDAVVRAMGNARQRVSLLVRMALPGGQSRAVRDDLFRTCLSDALRSDVVTAEDDDVSRDVRRLCMRMWREAEEKTPEEAMSWSVVDTSVSNLRRDALVDRDDHGGLAHMHAHVCAHVPAHLPRRAIIISVPRHPTLPVGS